MDMPELAPITDPQEVFERAAARGVPVYEPRHAVNCIRHWICRDHDRSGRDRRGNVRFRHCAEEHLPVMPPETAPDRHGSDTVSDRHMTGGPDGGRRDRPAMIVPFPGMSSPDMSSPGAPPPCTAPYNGEP